MNKFINNFIENEFKHSLIINEEDIKNLSIFEEFLKTLKGYVISYYKDDDFFKIEFVDINREEFIKNSTLINRVLRRGDFLNEKRN